MRRSRLIEVAATAGLTVNTVRLQDFLFIFYIFIPEGSRSPDYLLQESVLLKMV